MANLNFNILENFNYDNTAPKDESGNNLLFDNKLRDFDSKQYQDQKQRRIEEKELAIEVKNRLKSKTCHDIKLIEEELKNSIYLVRK